MNRTAKTALNSGKYVLDTQLGRGIFGITYRATQTKSGQTVVIKTLSESLHRHSDADQFKLKFLELAKRLSRCKHPNLVQVLDYFEDAGRPYLVMEYIPGQTLAKLIESDVLPEAKAIDYIRQTGDALSVLHKAGLLHRDIKPQNIIRRQNSDRVVLCEFGITCEFTPGVLQTHANLLSAGYAPLEQYCFDEKRTPATDIYALAATLYCLVLGRPPLPAPVRNSVTRSDSKERASGLHTRGDRLLFPQLSKEQPKLSSAVKQVLWRGLEIAASRRPQTLDAWLPLLPIQKKISKPQPSVRQPAVNQPKTSPVVLPKPNLVQEAFKPTPTKPQTSQLPKKNPIPQPVLTQYSVAKPKTQELVQAALKPTPPTPQPSQPATAQKLIDSQADLAEYFVTKLKTPGRTTVTSSKKRQTPKPTVASRQANGGNLRQLFGRKSPLGALLMTGAIAASAGVGFGFALRTNHPDEPGSTILHTKQAFPPSNNWPVSEPRL